MRFYENIIKNSDNEEVYTNGRFLSSLAREFFANSFCHSERNERAKRVNGVEESIDPSTSVGMTKEEDKKIPTAKQASGADSEIPGYSSRALALSF